MASISSQLETGKRHLQASNFERAIHALTPLVRESPPEVRAIHPLFSAYEALGRIESAEKTYEILLGQDLPEAVLCNVHLYMGRVYRECGHPERSLAPIEKAIGLRPDVREVYDDLLKTHESCGTLEEAAAFFEQAVKEQGERHDLRNFLAKTYERLGWWAEAREHARVAERQHATWTEPQHIRRRAEQQLRANPSLYQAAAARREAAGDTAGMLRYWFAWAETTGQADDFVEVGELCERNHELGRAEAAYNLALSKESEHAVARAALKRVKKKGQPPVSLERERYEPAELEQILDWFLQVEDARGGVAFFRRYRDRHPNYLTSLQLLARAQRAAGQLTDAEQTLLHLIDRSTVDSATAGAYRELAAVYQELGNHAEARAALRQAEQPTPGSDDHWVPSASVLYASWETFRSSGNWDEAVNYYSSLAREEPTNPDPYLFLSWVFEKMGRIEDAYEANRRAAFIYNTSKHFVRLAGFCKKHGLYEEAREAYKLAGREAPSDLEAALGPSNLPIGATRFDVRLRKILNQARATGRIGDAAESFSVLAERTVDVPLLFQLLGSACEENGDLLASAAAYNHCAALNGTYKSYGQLGDFYRTHGQREQAIAAYGTALELNPFYAHARDRLDLDAPGLYPPGRISGDQRCEDWARDVCEKPENDRMARQLCERLTKVGTLEAAGNVYRQLLTYHPSHLDFVLDLARLYHERGELDLARQELQRARTSGLARAVGGAEFNDLLKRIEQESPQSAGVHTGTEGQAALAIEEEAQQVAIEWYQERGKCRETKVTATTVYQAQRYWRQADQASDESQKALRGFLTAAALYEHLGQPDQTLHCLVDYARGMIRHYCRRGKVEMAGSLVPEALRLARNAVTPGRGPAILQVVSILDYLEGLETIKGPPASWDPPTMQKVQDLLADVRRDLMPRLQSAVGCLGEFLRGIASSGTFPDLAGPVYLAAIVCRRLHDMLPRGDYERVEQCLARWLPDHLRDCHRSNRHAQLVAKIPMSVSVDSATSTARLEIEIANEGTAPADHIECTLTPDPGIRAMEPRQSFFFLPHGHGHTFEFELADIPGEAGYAGVKVNLTYFDPTDRRRSMAEALPTFEREERPFHPVVNPYRPLPAAQVTFTPSYETLESGVRFLEERARPEGIQWELRAMRRTWALSGGEIKTVEVIARAAVERLNQLERTPAVVDVRDLDQVVDALTCQYDRCPHFRALVEGDDLHPEAKMVMASVTALTPDPEAWLSQEQLVQAVSRSNRDFGRNRVIKRLIDLCSSPRLMEENSTGPGETRSRIAIPLLHMWLRRQWPFSQAQAVLDQYVQMQRQKRKDELREQLNELRVKTEIIRRQKRERDEGDMPAERFDRLDQTYRKRRMDLLTQIEHTIQEAGPIHGRELIGMAMREEPLDAINAALKEARQHYPDLPPSFDAEPPADSEEALIRIIDLILATL